jgi:ubiquinone/menaquinone biosynthesis C-methylase UbiE
MTDPVGAMTERLFVDAGIGAGMRVLDLGCGNGDVSFLLARMVGAGGEVVGIDRHGPSLDAAREKAAGQGLTNLRFWQGDLGPLPAEWGRFDAAVGRRVLMYVPNPVDVVRQLAQSLRPGGIVVFQEHDSTLVPGRVTPLPLHDQVQGSIWQTVEREGTNLHMGFDLANVLEDAGLHVEHVRAEAVVQTPTTAYRGAAIVRAMLPRIVEHGVASAAEIDLDSLEQRLTDERLKARSTYLSDMVFGAWARKPHA